MKKLLLVLIILSSIRARSQDTAAQIKSIDSIAKAINSSNFHVQTDSINQNNAALGMSMKIYLTMVVDNKQLKKYINKSKIVQTENGVTKISDMASAFYFDKDKLIKVEEFMHAEGKQETVEWYFADDKPLYYTFPSDISEERAVSLIMMAKAMLEQFQKMAGKSN